MAIFHRATITPTKPGGDVRPGGGAVPASSAGVPSELFNHLLAITGLPAGAGLLARWGGGPRDPYDGDPFFDELQEVYDEVRRPA